MPWWVLLETTGRRTGRPRQTPLAAGPFDGHVLCLIAAQGRHSDYVRNIAATPRVRVRHRGRWYTGTAALADLDPAVLARFNRYARSSPRAVGIDPQLLTITLDEDVSG